MCRWATSCRILGHWQIRLRTWLLRSLPPFHWASSTSNTTTRQYGWALRGSMELWKTPSSTLSGVPVLIAARWMTLKWKHGPLHWWRGSIPRTNEFCTLAYTREMRNAMITIGSQPYVLSICSCSFHMFIVWNETLCSRPLAGHIRQLCSHLG